jgi:hypothetical protein
MGAEPNAPASSAADLLISGEGGIAGTHPRLAAPIANVAPTLGERFNTIGFRVTPLACWRAHDMRFAFASSFPLPELQLELQGLERLIATHTLSVDGQSHRPPIAIFGHADPTGNDEFNKVLSGRRAQSIFALLTRDLDLMESLFAHPHGDDVWGDPALRTMVAATSPTSNDATRADAARVAARDPAARRALYLAYADTLCVRRDGTPFRIARTDFLDRGADPKAKGAVMGCGEFNPVMVFSASEQRAFTASPSKTARDRENAGNRRVVIFLFRPGVNIDVRAWPCPRATEGSGDCRKRFFSNSTQRLSNGSERRTYEQTHDTFACRFYDRLSNRSPCERFLPRLIPFRYGLEVGDAMPWPLDATLRYVSEDGTIIKSFVIGEGELAAGMRVFTFDDYPRDVRFRGEVVQGDFVIPLFGLIDIGAVQDPSDADEVLPLPSFEAVQQRTDGPTVPIDLDPSREA